MRPKHAAGRLIRYGASACLCAPNLMTVGEALQLVLRSRPDDNDCRPRLQEVEPSYRFSRCPRLVA